MSHPSSPEPTGTLHPSVHRVPDDAAPSTEAMRLASAALTGPGCVYDHVAAACDHLSRMAGVENVLIALQRASETRLPGWTRLGERAWLREWVSPGSALFILGTQNAEALHRVSLPWLSLRAREGVVVVPDVSALPTEASVDREELHLFNVGSVASVALLSDDVMFGSVSVSSTRARQWPPTQLADLRLLMAALTGRMATIEAQHELASTLSRGDQVRTSQYEFFSAFGHEMHRPIQTIVATAEGLLLPPSTDSIDELAATTRHDATVMEEASRRMVAVVDDLLGAGVELSDSRKPGWVDVASAVTDAVAWLADDAAAAGVAVGVDVADGVAVRTTPSGLRQVVSSLIGNAVANNRPGGLVVVSVERLAGDIGAPRARIGVRDTGPGLTGAEREEVFRPFIRRGGKNVSGPGLGLSLSRSIVERDGGRMGVDSEPGAGSEFWVELPCQL